eukprot:scaffold378224_cov16-Prasinocladus_malaysianus.AAC.1
MDKPRRAAIKFANSLFSLLRAYYAIPYLRHLYWLSDNRSLRSDKIATPVVYLSGSNSWELAVCCLLLSSMPSLSSSKCPITAGIIAITPPFFSLGLRTASAADATQ